MENKTLSEAVQAQIKKAATAIANAKIDSSTSETSVEQIPNDYYKEVMDRSLEDSVVHNGHFFQPNYENSENILGNIISKAIFGTGTKTAPSSSGKSHPVPISGGFPRLLDSDPNNDNNELYYDQNKSEGHKHQPFVDPQNNSKKITPLEYRTAQNEYLKDLEDNSFSNFRKYEETVLKNQVDNIKTNNGLWKDGVWQLENNGNVILDSSLNGTANVSDKTTDSTTNGRYIHPLSKRKGMSTIEMIQHSGPDFIQNKFDVYFLWDPTELDAPDDIKSNMELMQMKNNTPIEKYFLDHRCFAVRTGQISVPAVFNQDYNIPFLETQINKVRSTKTNDNQSSFTFRLDQDLIWLNEFQLLTGRLLQLDNSIVSNDATHDYVNVSKKNNSLEGITITKKENWQQLFNCISKTWPTVSKGSPYDIKRTGLCIIAKMEHLSNYINLNYQQKVLPYYVFENVKILGTSDKISYVRDSAEIQDITINFIFKRSYELMPDINVRNNDSGNSWQKVFNRPSEEFDLELGGKPKRYENYKIPIYDDKEHYNAIKDQKSDAFQIIGG